VANNWRRSPSRILLARDVASGELLKAEVAQHLPPRGTYECLDKECAGDVNVCERPKGSGRFYFRHRALDDCENCGFHSRHDRSNRRHSVAQHLLILVLNEAIHRRQPMPILEFQVAGTTRQVMPLVNAMSVIPEWICPYTGRRADIALLDDNQKPALLIEVFHTHAVDRHKRRDLSPYWWVEIEANAIIADHEHLPVRHCGNLPYVFGPETQQRSLPGMKRTEW